MQIQRLLSCLFCIVVATGLVLAPGCSDGRPARVPVSGQVLIDGQPLKYGFVRFLPEGSRGSGGELNANGHFTLTCFEPNDGATLGVHRVEVSACEGLTATKFKWHAPKKYAAYSTSGLQQDITGPNNNLIIELTWNGGKPFVEVEEGGGTDAWAVRKKK
jgi:hypothetical protein